MTHTVWKFPLAPQPVSQVAMPAGAEIIHVAEQFGVVCLWARVDPGAPAVTRTIAIRGTNDPVPSPSEGKHLGTVMHLNGEIVLHIFERVAPGGPS